MLYFLLLTLASIIPFSPLPSDHFDLIEINHYYDDDGNLYFTQVIGWDWSDSFADYIVQAYVLLNKKESITLPTLKSNIYEYKFIDQAHTVRKVTSKFFRETWTQYDPELVDRNRFPHEDRRDFQLKTYILIPIVGPNIPGN
jgi:hypothetical protein